MLDVLFPELSQAGIAIVPFSSLDADDHDRLTKYFDENVYPVLTPLAVDPGHPFPMISNLSLNITVYVRDDVTGGLSMAVTTAHGRCQAFIARRA